MNSPIEIWIQRFAHKNGKLPETVICTPLAALALSLQKISLTSIVPVVVQDIDPEEVVDTGGTRLGVIVLSMKEIRVADLR